MIRSRNAVEIIGNVGRDPNPPRQGSNSTKVVVIWVATSEEWKKNNEEKTITEWHKVVAYRTLASMADGVIKKGMKVCVVGKIKSVMRTLPTGEERKESYIEAEDIFIHVRELNKSARSNDQDHEETTRYNDSWDSGHERESEDTDVNDIPL